MESRNGTMKSPKPSMDPAEDAKQPSNDGEISVHDCEPPVLDVEEVSPEQGEKTQTMDSLTKSEQSQTLSQCADQEVMSSGEKQSLPQTPNERKVYGGVEWYDYQIKHQMRTLFAACVANKFTHECSLN